MNKQRSTLEPTKDILVSYIKNIPKKGDIDKFLFNFNNEDNTEVVSNMSSDTINIVTVMERGLVSNDELLVIKEITDQAFARQ